MRGSNATSSVKLTVGACHLLRRSGYLGLVKRKKLPKPARSTLPAPALGPEMRIKFKANVVIPPGVAGPIGRFLRAGDPSPFHAGSEVPPNLRGFIVQPGDEPDSEPDDSPQLNYTVNTLYSVDANDRRRARSVEREILNLQRAQEEQAAWEDYLSREPDDAVKAALANAHAAGSGLAIAEAQYQAKQNAMAEQHAKKFVEEGDQNDEADFVSPSIQEQNL